MTPFAYNDEPHPNNEHDWKSWWVKKCFDPKTELTTEALIWIDQCWRETLARWNCPNEKGQDANT